MSQRPYLNLGAGRIILPAERPAHHVLVDEAIYSYPLYWNVDRNMQPGIDECVDLFRCPWPWDDNSFDGALMTHLVEHIPHEIRLHDYRGEQVEIRHSEREFQTITYAAHPQYKRVKELENAQDGWYAFFMELYRVLTDGAIVHILSPYGWSNGAITDPTHTRYITEHTFTHSMKPDPDSPFEYSTGGIHFEQDAPARFGGTGLFPTDDMAELQRHLQTRLNVAHELYVKLRVVK